MTLRGKLPILLSEMIGNGYSISFDNVFHGPTISWTYPGTDLGGHIHLDEFVPGEHGSNMILIERALLAIIDETNSA